MLQFCAERYRLALVLHNIYSKFNKGWHYNNHHTGKTSQQNRTNTKYYFFLWKCEAPGNWKVHLLKGDLLCKIHFYKMCVYSVFKQPAYNGKHPPTPFL